MLGYVKHHADWDWEGARVEFERALALEPDHADSVQGYSEALLSLGRLDEALAQARRAVELDPLTPIITMWLGYCYYHARRYDDALETNAQALELEPDLILARYLTPEVLLWGGRHEEAIASVKELLAWRGRDTDTSPYLATFYAVAGQEEEARRILSRVNPDQVDAEAWASLGDMDRAFAALERAFRDRSQGLLWIKTDPSMDPLRGDPRFADLLRRMGLPD